MRERERERNRKRERERERERHTFNLARIGIIKAAVLPDPVGAHANISLPAITIGILCICIGVGPSYPHPSGASFFKFSMI